jgi:hypothetical protein
MTVGATGIGTVGATGNGTVGATGAGAEKGIGTEGATEIVGAIRTGESRGEH